ncbi:hypothetical protein MKW98_024220 [Papaver atlanticum]|uniref:RING-type domain-containing protein n=1 Tax=Papaver atlanticum TaxID=357466 RepID=A0AAD4T089_9MAGN|nr:hypothetical protein MKW98_024220 [Papaver atlanticum]
MESTRGISNFGSSMEGNGATSTRVSVKISGTTISGVVVSEHGGSQSQMTTAASSQYYTGEYIDRSRFSFLPRIVQLLLNDIHEPSQGDSNHQVIVRMDRTTSDIVEVDIITQANWRDLEPGFHRWLAYCNNVSIRSKARARAAVEAMTKIYIIDDDEVVGCSICLEKWRVGDDVRRSACGHEFHPSCIETWLIKDKQGSCPNCRAQLMA